MTAHLYGPHDPNTAPDAIVVGRAGNWPTPREEVRPLSAAVVRQRAAINRNAHQAAARSLLHDRPPACNKPTSVEVAAALVHPNVAALLAATGGHPTRHGADQGRVRRAAYRFRPGQPITWSTP